MRAQDSVLPERAISDAHFLLYGASADYTPDAAALAKAHYLLNLASSLGAYNDSLYETIICRRAPADGGNLIIKAYQRSAKNSDISALARLYVIYQFGIYEPADTLKAREIFFKLQAQFPKNKVAEQLFLAFFRYAKKSEALFWQNCAINSGNVLQYLKMLDAPNYETARILLADNMNRDSDNAEIYAFALSQILFKSGKYAESLKIAEQYKDSDLFKSSAALYFVLSDLYAKESAKAKDFWFEICLQKDGSKSRTFKNIAGAYKNLNTPNSDQKAVDFYIKAAQLKDPEAAVMAAKILESEPSECDAVKKAENLYLKAIEYAATNPQFLSVKIEAQSRLVKIYLFGLSSVAKNKTRALELLEDMAKSGSAQAIAKLYVYKYTGFAGSKDSANDELKRLFALNQKAGSAELEIANAIRQTRLETGKLLKKEFFDFLEKSANLGNPTAQYKLAIQYLFEKKSKSAKELILKSAQGGNLSALALIYVGLCEGNDLFKKNQNQAKLIYQNMIFRYGARDVNTAIARYYERGIGVRKDIKKSRFFAAHSDSCTMDDFYKFAD